MAEFKLTVGDPKTGQSHKKDISGKEADALLGKDIGETIPGDSLGFAGYEFVITGGSDHAGFPMRPGIQGAGRKKILTYKGTGFKGRSRWKKTERGLRVKKTICGQKVYPKITQVNLKITKAGPNDLFTAEAAPAEEPKEAPPEKKEKAPVEVKKEKLKKEAPKAEEKPVKEEAPKEEKK